MRRSAIFLLVLPWLALACDPPEKPPLQTLPKNTGDDLEDKIVAPTPEERTVATARLEKAIAAHGGGDRLKRLNCHVQKLRGLAFNRETTEQELQLQFPRKARLSVKMPDGMGGFQNMLLVLDGESAWISVAGASQDMTPAQLHDTVQDVELRSILTLLPLRDKDAIIRPIDGQPFENRPTVGLKVKTKTHPPVDLFFDAENGLLVRSVCRVREASSILLREMRFTNFKDFDGLRLPTHVVDIRNGSTSGDVDVDYRFPVALNPGDFIRP